MAAGYHTIIVSPEGIDSQGFATAGEALWHLATAGMETYDQLLERYTRSPLGFSIKREFVEISIRWTGGPDARKKVIK